MKKKLLLMITILAIVAGSLSYLYSNRDQFTNKKVAGRQEELSGAERERTISENIKRYQPKGDTGDSAGPQIAAAAAIVVDQNTNEILYAKNVHGIYPPASVIKLLTFSIAMENFEEDELIEISENASAQISNKINMKPGERLKTSDLLYGLMMISANDAAYAFADAAEGGFNAFVEQANDKAELLGLKNTVMKNPAGLDEDGQTSSVFDLATITRYTLLEHPQIIQYAGKTTEHSVYGTEDNEPHWWFGHLSRMLTSYQPMIAAKTGYTDEAGNTYIGIAERGERRLVLAILAGKNTSINNEVQALLDYGFSK